MPTRLLLRAVALGGAVTALVAGTALAADAHVRVYTYTPAVQGGDAALVFRVPSEEPSNTVSVAVSLPSATPIPSIAVEDVPGWTATVTHRTLASPVQTDDGPVTQVVSSVTWTAAKGGGILPDEFAEFSLSAEGLPKVASLDFPTVQTYANGDVVRWIEPTPAGGDEPDHPVPVLDLQPAASTTTASAGTSSSAMPAVYRVAASHDDGTARGLGIAGLVVGALGLVVAAAALLTRRRAS